MGQVFSFTLWSVFLRAKSLQYHVNRKLGETLTGDLDTLETVKITCPRRDSISQNVAVCTKTFSNRVDSH